MLTSEYPDQCTVLSETSTTPTHVLCSANFPSEQDVMKFFIGLRLLGDEKTHRLLSYIQVLLQEQAMKEKYDEL